MVALSSCVGPPAPDVAICRDLIHRITLSPRCSSTAVLNLPDQGAESALLVRTTCQDDAFEFSTPSRDRVLECRAPLVRNGIATDTHPDCLDVDQLLTECPDVTRFLQGVKP
jgi:hypothetical protein